MSEQNQKQAVLAEFLLTQAKEQKMFSDTLDTVDKLAVRMTGMAQEIVALRKDLAAARADADKLRGELARGEEELAALRGPMVGAGEG